MTAVVDSWSVQALVIPARTAGKALAVEGGSMVEGSILMTILVILAIIALIVWLARRV